ncbi:MAG: helical backbone metal receptor [Flavobacteriales bacterium]
MNNTKISISDQLGRPISLPSPAIRIISLVPSITELLFDLGLKDRVVGVTKFCVHPAEASNQSRIGGTKNPKIDQIIALQPDLVIANKEENRKEDFDALAEHFKVYVSDVVDLDSAFAMFNDLGILTATQPEAKLLINQIKTSWNSFLKPVAKVNVLYAIWKNPWMFAGIDTYINHVLIHLGFDNSLHQNRYPQLDISQIKDLSPEFLFLSSEPYPFKNQDLVDLQQQLPHTKVLLVDGEAFSWYGSRMKHCASYLQQLMTELT